MSILCTSTALGHAQNMPSRARHDSVTDGSEKDKTAGGTQRLRSSHHQWLARKPSQAQHESIAVSRQGKPLRLRQSTSWPRTTSAAATTNFFELRMPPSWSRVSALESESLYRPYPEKTIVQLSRRGPNPSCAVVGASTPPTSSPASPLSLSIPACLFHPDKLDLTWLTRTSQCTVVCCGLRMRSSTNLRAGVSRRRPLARSWLRARKLQLR